MAIDLYPEQQADRYRRVASRALDPSRRAALGQFLTPGPLARFLASFFERLDGEVRLLDAGAGAGALVAATFAEAAGRSPRRRTATKIVATAFEVDPDLAAYAGEVVRTCAAEARTAGISFRGNVECRDFVAAGVELVSAKPEGRFTHAILNPPYRKLGSCDPARARLRQVGIETTNLYAAFVALAVRLLVPGGEIVAITPRSFANGPYFRRFRELLLGQTAIARVHVFESRTAAFAEDDVLQENVIVHAIKGAPRRDVTLSCGDTAASRATVPFDRLVRPGDPERFIHLGLPTEATEQRIADAFDALPADLAALGLSVSTGRVVDFRVRSFLRARASLATHPLVYPVHLVDGLVRWPRRGKKPNALVAAPRTEDLWMPRGTYVVVKRFSAKEEPRRVVAAVFDPELVPAAKIGFENHLNVFHVAGAGVPRDLARGLAAFLNSTFVDAYVRQFSGHTQINATDLRSLRYPARATLEKLGSKVGDRTAAGVDTVVAGLLGWRVRHR